MQSSVQRSQVEKRDELEINLDLYNAEEDEHHDIIKFV